MKQPFTIRNATPQDMPEIIELCAAHAEYEKAEYNREGKQDELYKHLFQSGNELNCLVVEQETELIGYATFIKQFSTWDAAFYVYLDCLYLKEKVRGQGIGVQLMAKIKEFSTDQNCIAVQWQTPTFNEPAIRFYNRLGATAKSKQRFTWD
jgi:L-amino acid N-acyltransferase YncA